MQRTRAARPIDERVDFFFTARRGRASRGSWSRTRAGELRWCPSPLPHPMVPHEAYALSQLGTDQRYLSHGFDTTLKVSHE